MNANRTVFKELLCKISEKFVSKQCDEALKIDLEIKIGDCRTNDPAGRLFSNIMHENEQNYFQKQADEFYRNKCFAFRPAGSKTSTKLCINVNCKLDTRINLSLVNQTFGVVRTIRLIHLCSHNYQYERTLWPTVFASYIQQFV